MAVHNMHAHGNSEDGVALDLTTIAMVLGAIVAPKSHALLLDTYITVLDNAPE